MNRTLAVLAVTATCVAGGSAITTAPAAAATQVVVVPTGQIQFRWVAGLATWQAPNLSRLQRSAFVFAANGSFAMFQADGYPTLRGTYRVSSGTATFHGSFANSAGYTGSITAEVYGTLDTRGVMRIDYVSGATLAAVFPDLGGGRSGIGYSASRTKAYTAVFNVRRA
jgi:hypothetical protein